jgi:protein gp37
MGKDTAIEWCDHSFNAWWGCTKVSPACDHCYAEVLAKRVGHPDLWGVNADRRTFGEKHWLEPVKWNLAAAKVFANVPADLIRDGTVRRPRVFCNSMADVFDNHEGVSEARERLWRLIHDTPHIDWLILTKRVGNIPRMLPSDWGEGYPNVWLIISVCNQDEADRDIVKLLQIPAVVRGISAEPLLGRIDLSAFQKGVCTYCAGAGEVAANGPTTTFPEDDDGVTRCYECGGTGKWEDNPGLQWVIAGGESGAGARYMDLFWASNLLSECRSQDIPFFMKQLSQADFGKDFDDYPSLLKVREWPKP